MLVPELRTYSAHHRFITQHSALCLQWIRQQVQAARLSRLATGSSKADSSLQRRFVVLFCDPIHDCCAHCGGPFKAGRSHSSTNRRATTQSTTSRLFPRHGTCHGFINSYITHLVRKASNCTIQRTIVQIALFNPPLSPRIPIDLSVLQRCGRYVTVLHLGPITLATFVSADMRRLLDQTMPQLNDFKIIVEPPSAVSRPVLPRIRIRPERLPALRYLHIEGAVLLCESLSQLR